MDITEQLRLGGMNAAEVADVAADIIEQLRAQVENTRAAMSFLGHVVVAAGGRVAVPRKQVEMCRYPMMTRTEDLATGDTVICATLD